MKVKTLMVQGTASSAGKSIIATALCRILKQDGYTVCPFKAQNMALNSFVTIEGGEIGRSQAVQAEAAGIAPSVHMNPVLLKPEADARSQVIVLGKVAYTITASNYYKKTGELLKTIETSLNHLRTMYDIIVIEGAGSPAEINLKRDEIVNMRIAKLAAAPVLLVADIDRGGVFASLVGTMELLDESERKYVKGFIINKFRGDVSLLKDGLDFLESKTGVPVLGVIPYFRDIAIAQEDSVYLDERAESKAGADLDIAIIRLPHISNYDDFDPLEWDGCNVRYVSGTNDLGRPDMVILPGTKSTMSDLVHLNDSGLAADIVQLARAGTSVIGICGGYQMLGRRILDPNLIEADKELIEGLGLLDVETTFIEQKSTVQIKAKVAADHGLLAGLKGQQIEGYEIHMGQTVSDDNTGAFHVNWTPSGASGYVDGTVSDDGMVLGTYIHGIFNSALFRLGLLNTLRRKRGLPERLQQRMSKDEQYDKLAKLVHDNLDMKKVYQLLEAGIDE
ncbi:cobyric acid synthase [Chloroflexota bacterium]